MTHRPLLLALAACTAAAVFAPVSAEAGQQSPALRYNSPLDTTRINGIERMNQVTSEAERQQMTRRAGTAAQRAERAERLSALVNAGQCRTAYETAVAEHDRSMAQRIGQVCTASAESGGPATGPDTPAEQ